MRVNVQWIITGAVVLFATLTQAQQMDPTKDPKYGPDSASRVECIKNQSLYNEFYKQKNYVDALIPWRKTVTICPTCSKNLFLHGISIYKFKIANTKDAALRDKYIDSLMVIYDDRVKYTGNEGVALGRKGVDLFALRESSFADAYEFLNKSVDLQQDKSEGAVLNDFMRTSVMMLKAEKINKEAMVINYMKSADYLASLIKSTSDEKEKETLTTVAANVDQMFSESGAADCATLSGIFKPKLEASPDNIDLLKNICKIFDRNKCADESVYAQASENLYKVEPSAESAYNLARMFLKRENYNKASGYYSEAINLQQDSLIKSQLYFELGTLTLAQGNASGAVQNARNSLKFNPKEGRSYLLIGKSYASDTKSVSDDDFKRSAVYWVAVDKFIKAKQVDEKVAEEATTLINQYSEHFPTKENGFFYDVKEGQSYTVEGWINESTTARYNR